MSLEHAMDIEYTDGYDPRTFLDFFKKADRSVYKNYVRLNEENGSLEEFENKPLSFILSNEPACCVDIARMFLDEARDSLAEDNGGPPEYIFVNKKT